MKSSSETPTAAAGPTILTRSLEVGYRRKKGAQMGLRGLDASFSAGVTGLVGPNGAGKSTFLRTACGLLSPGAGEISIGGVSPRRYVGTRGLGFLPENPPLPSYLTVREFLSGLPPFPGDPSGEDRDPDPALGLGQILDQGCDALSLGQRKKVALAAALRGDPQLLLLDEPTNGLDPVALKELRQTLLRERDRGCTIVVSSHHLDELQRTADGIVFILNGKGVGAWTREEAMDRFGSLETLFDETFGGEEI